MKKVGLNKSPRYISFVRARNAGLEKILQTAQIKITAVLQEKFGWALSIIVSDYRRLLQDATNGVLPTSSLQNLDASIGNCLQSAVPDVVALIFRMRKNTYLLSAVGEAEAIGRALNRPTEFKTSRAELQAISFDRMKGGQTIIERTQIAMNRVKRDLMDAVELSLSLGEPDREARIRLYRALPKRKFFSQIPNALRDVKTREAKASVEPVASMTVAMVDDSDWQAIVKDYLDENIPPIRGPEYIIGTQIVKGERKNVYAWELERDVNQAFVEDVRRGQVDAAKANGIIDFVWVAVIDDRTEGFDRWADGKLTSEIRDAIDSGRAPESEFQSEVPPAHFGCRCDLAPATEDLPDPEPSNLEDFESWLKT